MARSLADRFGAIVGAALKADGFGQKRLRWATRSQLGDWAIIEVQKSRPMYGAERFYLDTSIVPEPWPDWLAHLYPQRILQDPPAAASGVALDRFNPPPAYGGGGAWTLPTEEVADEAAQWAAAALTEQVVPGLRRLLDRDVLLAKLDAQDRDTEGLRAAYAAQAGDLAAMEAALARYDWDDAAEFGAWARGYALARKPA